MEYPLSNKYKAADRLEPAEEMVQRALSKYIDTALCTDFVASKDLYATYIAFYNQFHMTFEMPERLNNVLFGVALRRVYDLDPEDRVTRRWTRGRKLWGYLGLRGPLSVSVPATSGNPAWRKKCST